MPKYWKPIGFALLSALLIVVFQNCGADFDPKDFDKSSKAFPPILIEPAQNRTVLESQGVALSVKTTGSDLRYIWTKDGQVLTTTGRDYFDIPFAQSSDSGTYTVQVFNNLGSFSESMTLTVDPITTTLGSPPSIVSQPQNTSGFEGHSSVVLAVSANGPSLEFQWFYKQPGVLGLEAPVSGATKNYLVISPVTHVHSGSWRVRVNNVNGSVMSEYSTVDVQPYDPQEL